LDFVYHLRQESTISDLQADIERLSLALHQWHETERQLQPLEQRLSQLTERGTEVLNNLVDTDQRHTHAVSAVEAKLNEWGAIEDRLHRDSLERIRAFEKTIAQEWHALRGMHEEPLKQLREQAAALGETCVAAANLSLRGYERAEARLAALEEDLRGQLAQLSRDVHAALAEVRRPEGRQAQLASGAAPFPLDSVMRIHEELRESGAPSSSLVPSRPDVAPSAPQVPEDSRQLPAPAALSDRMDSLERELTTERQERRDATAGADELRRNWRVSLGALAVALIVLGGLGIRLQQHVNARLDDASTRAEAAEKQAEAASAAADREIASARAETTAARNAAAKAALASEVLTSPDLVRFNLTGVGDASSAFGQVMWSRSRGLIVSTSLLPPVAAGSTYQAWLMSNATPIKAGELVPDATGRATLVAENPSDLPRPINGVSVTMEPTGRAGAIPSGGVVLIRAVAIPSTP
jgi:hypothetical protein